MNYQKMSKEISYALRHAPWKYELELDDEGWVPVNQLLTALHQSKEWENITQEDIEKMILISEKKRHELSNGKIRALYGHSVPMKIIKKKAIPPRKLYHGTSPKFMESISESGLLPMSRQYVHLSEDIETAKLVGKRKTSVPVILIIDTEEAQKKGIKFYLGNEKVWLADSIPIECISIKK
ncbi:MULTISPECIES: RNA 2'-phosphotransferase [unclassified Bacillus (in: firmicutes)]|uniref:RNA 2'-phosphotransferase n=1 Tax=unclassified Bacillus (in: firmicutes) TaxID=185979 RepID=UPI0008E9B31F|nr:MULTISPECIES: RNA 2'-phosphotransferase [unclassified Bacillus (in: firmicutes)]SFH95482.1 putative RNA 2'-phosphotransferase [Bacillus sp. 71mf]SFS95044.1 putative RNA 2'-phosphotransferase [Bacillus sp. 103mf]